MERSGCYSLGVHGGCSSIRWRHPEVQSAILKNPAERARASASVESEMYVGAPMPMFPAMRDVISPVEIRQARFKNLILTFAAFGGH